MSRDSLTFKEEKSCLEYVPLTPFVPLTPLVAIVLIWVDLPLTNAPKDLDMTLPKAVIETEADMRRRSKF